VIHIEVNKIYQGDALKILKTFPDESVDCIITSPPYFSQRYYGKETNIVWDGDENCKHKFKFMQDFKTGYCKKCGAWYGQLGLEPHPKLFIKHICDIVEECMRTLKNNGNMFLNIGDTWASATHKNGYNKYGENWLKEKQKLFIPYRIAIELQDRGYIVREDIIWTKKVTKFPQKETIGFCMPSPIIDKFLLAHEVILHIIKNKKVKSYINRIKCKLKKSTFERAKYPVSATYKIQDESNPYLSQKNGMDAYFKKLDVLGKKIGSELKLANPTSCIMFKKENQHKVKGSHFAKFPLSLPRLFIEGFTDKGDIILDPFIGSGTTAIVSLKLGRKFVGIELNPDYVKMAYNRIKPYLEQKSLLEVGDLY